MKAREASAGRSEAGKRSLLVEVFLEMVVVALMEFSLLVLVMSVALARQGQRANYLRAEQLAYVLAARLSGESLGAKELSHLGAMLAQQVGGMESTSALKVVVYKPGAPVLSFLGGAVDVEALEPLLRRAHLSGAPVSPPPRGLADAFGKGWTWTAVPIGGGADARPRGSVAVGVPRLSPWHWLRGQWMLAGYAVVLLLTLLGLGAYRVHTLVIRPIERLVFSTHQIAVGSREFQGSNPRTRELAALEGHLADMTSQLLRREQDLKRRLAEIEQAQAELIESEKLATVGRLASGVAHEVGNPLSALAGYLELLADPALDVSERADLVRRSSQELQRADGILRGLLDFARAQPSRPQAVELQGLADHLMDMVKGQRIFHNVEIIKDTEGPVRAWADPGLVEQVLVNLLINAADAMDGQGRIRLSVERAPAPRAGAPWQQGTQAGGGARLNAMVSGMPAAVVRIRDQGPGVSAADAARVFDPFFTTKAPGAGTGLGLAVSAQVAARQGGLLRLAERGGERPWEGACFELWLPLEEESEGEQ